MEKVGAKKGTVRNSVKRFSIFLCFFFCSGHPSRGLSSQIPAPPNPLQPARFPAAFSSVTHYPSTPSRPKYHSTYCEACSAALQRCKHTTQHRPSAASSDSYPTTILAILLLPSHHPLALYAPTSHQFFSTLLHPPASYLSTNQHLTSSCLLLCVCVSVVLPIEHLSRVLKSSVSISCATCRHVLFNTFFHFSSIPACFSLVVLFFSAPSIVSYSGPSALGIRFSSPVPVTPALARTAKRTPPSDTYRAHIPRHSKPSRFPHLPHHLPFLHSFLTYLYLPFPPSTSLPSLATLA